jgi:hypothetical protein
MFFFSFLVYASAARRQALDRWCCMTTTLENERMGDSSSSTAVQKADHRACSETRLSSGRFVHTMGDY